MYRVGSLMTVSRELSYGKGNETHELGTGFLVYKRIMSAVRRVKLMICHT
jgi:hypothetical protein